MQSMRILNDYGLYFFTIVISGIDACQLIRFEFEFLCARIYCFPGIISKF